MMLRNTRAEWGTVAKALHWLGAALILALLAHGWWMTHLAPREGRIAQYAWHASIGYDLLALLVFRLLWRWLNPVPALPGELKPWERWAAHLGHLGLYVLSFAAAVAGWALAGTFRQPMDSALFGLLRVPQLAGNADRSLHGLLEETHGLLAYALALLVLVHVAGALRHQFWKRNPVLRRMVWRPRRA